MAVNVVGLFMALLSFVESAPRAYRLKASNAAPPFSTSAGTSASRASSIRRINKTGPSWWDNLQPFKFKNLKALAATVGYDGYMWIVQLLRASTTNLNAEH
jgi:hypothetical protein